FTKPADAKLCPPEWSCRLGLADLGARALCAPRHTRTHRIARLRRATAEHAARRGEARAPTQDNGKPDDRSAPPSRGGALRRPRTPAATVARRRLRHQRHRRERRAGGGSRVKRAILIALFASLIVFGAHDAWAQAQPAGDPTLNINLGSGDG